MTTLKNSIEGMSADTKELVKKYMRLFALKQTEKLALLLGLLFSIFVFSVVILIIIVFCSFVLAGFLNTVLKTEYAGFLIVIGAYLIGMVLFALRIIVRKKPLLVNLFVKFISSVLEIDLKQSDSLNGIRQERENINQSIEDKKGKMKSDFQMLRYIIMEAMIKEAFGLFSSKKEPKPDTDKESTDETTSTTP